MTRLFTALRTAGLLGLVGATVLALDWCAWRPLRCIHRSSLGTAALDAAAGQDENAVRREGAHVRTELAGCDCVWPPDARIALALGGAFAASGDPRSAITEYQSALTLDRRPELYLYLGMARMDALQRDAALESFVRACAFDPGRLLEIPYPETRQETARRIRARYGADWIPPR